MSINDAVPASDKLPPPLPPKLKLTPLSTIIFALPVVSAEKKPPVVSNVAIPLPAVFEKSIGCPDAALIVIELLPPATLSVAEPLSGSTSVKAPDGLLILKPVQGALLQLLEIDEPLASDNCDVCMVMLPAVALAVETVAPLFRLTVEAESVVRFTAPEAELTV